MRDAIVKMISESTIPTNQGVQIISALNQLKPITKKEDAKKEAKQS